MRRRSMSRSLERAWLYGMLAIAVAMAAFSSADNAAALSLSVFDIWAVLSAIAVIGLAAALVAALFARVSARRTCEAFALFFASQTYAAPQIARAFRGVEAGHLTKVALALAAVLFIVLSIALTRWPPSHWSNGKERRVFGP